MIRKKLITIFFTTMLLVNRTLHSSQTHTLSSSYSPERSESPTEESQNQDPRYTLLCSSFSSGNNSLGPSDIPVVIPPGTPRKNQVVRLQKQLSELQLKLQEVAQQTFHKRIEEAREERKTKSADSRYSEHSAQSDGARESELKAEGSSSNIPTRIRSASQISKPTIPTLNQSGSHSGSGSRIPEIGAQGSRPEIPRQSARRETISIAPITEEAFRTVAEAKKNIQEEQAEINDLRRHCDTRERELYAEWEKIVREEAIITAFDKHIHSLNSGPQHSTSALSIFSALGDTQNSLRSNPPSSPFLPQLVGPTPQNSHVALSTAQQMLTLQNPLVAAVISLAVYISHDEKLLDRLSKLADRILNWTKPIASQPSQSPQPPSNTIPPTLPDIVVTCSAPSTIETVEKPTAVRKQTVIAQTLAHTLFCKDYLQSLISESLFANTAQTIAPYLISSLRVQNGWKYMACYMGIDIGGTFINEYVKRIIPHKRPLGAYTRPQKKPQSATQIVMRAAKAILAYYISSNA